MDEVDAADELGPVDWIVVEFPGSRFNGQIVPALLDLVDQPVGMRGGNERQEKRRCGKQGQDAAAQCGKELNHCYPLFFLRFCCAGRPGLSA